MGLLRKIFLKPLDTAAEETRYFLSPQLEEISCKRKWENIYALITWHSLAYVIGVGEERSNRSIIDSEVMPFLVAVFGNDYKPRIELLLQNINPDAFNQIRQDLKASNSLQNFGYLTEHANQVNCRLFG